MSNKLDIAIEIGLKKLGSKGEYWCREYNALVEETMRKFPRGYRAKEDDKWCAIFISDIMMLAGVKDFPIEVSAHRMCNSFDVGYIVDVSIEPVRKYDLVFYDWNKDRWRDHVGIVVNADARYIYVLEGNYNKKVGVRKILRTSTAIFTVIDLKNWYDDVVSKQ